MKIKKMSSLFIIAYFCISCVSLRGNHYYNCNSNFPLNMVYLDDSTSIMYYANSIPVSKIHYVVDSLCKSSRKRQTCTINKVDIIDYCIYDYLNKRLPREGTIRNQLICEGDKIMILNDYLVFMNDNHILYLFFYSKSKKKKVIKYSKNICRGLVFNKYQGDGEN